MGKRRVFISYAFVDTEHPDYLFAQRLADDLRAAGADVVTDKGNIAADDFIQYLNQVLLSCLLASSRIALQALLH